MPKKPVAPAVPIGMELLFFYMCPYCNCQVALVAPTQPAMAQCDSCGMPFPIMPVDERSIQFIRIILNHGRAAVDPDFT